VKRDSLTKGGDQTLVFIPESDVYRLIMCSKLPAAQRFERWGLEKILPTIRKHGMYATAETMEAIIRDPQFGIRLLSELQGEWEQRKAIE
jgi:prophage antirepressor-like protein